jgi:hypothetical protein
MDLSRTERRILWIGTALAGVLHLLGPDTLLATARYSYRYVMAVDFRPREGATRRVRAVGVLFLGLAAALRRLLHG